MSLTRHIILTQTSLEHVLSSVRGLHDMSTELIAEEGKGSMNTTFKADS